MKRLFALLSDGIKPVYEGRLMVVWNDSCPPTSDNSSVYYDGEVGYEFSRSNKRQPDLPTVVVQIPCSTLYESAFFEDESVRTAAADMLLREFSKFISPLNDMLENRARPVTENGWFYVYEPGGEVIERNSAFFKVLPTRDYEYGGGTKVYILPADKLRPPMLN